MIRMMRVSELIAAVALLCTTTGWAAKTNTPGSHPTTAMAPLPAMQDFTENTALGAELETRAGTEAEYSRVQKLADRGLRVARDLVAANRQNAAAQYMLGSWLIYGYRVVTTQETTTEAAGETHSIQSRTVVVGMGDDPTEGLTALKIASDLAPANAQYALDYAAALLDTGQSGQALAVLQAAWGGKPALNLQEKARAGMLLSDAYAARDRIPDARKWLYATLLLNADNTEVVNRLPALDTAMAALAVAEPTPVGVPSAGSSARALIAGVPFISIREGCAIEHPSLTFEHPSSRAAHMMALRYHRPEARTWEDYLKATDDQKGSLREDWGHAKGLDELRAFLSAGDPVIVVTARTPYAHELYGVFEMLLSLGAGGQPSVNLQDLDSQDYSSRILGRMVGLDIHRKIGEMKLANAEDTGTADNGADGESPQDAPRMNPLHESATRCARVVVGLDPARRVVIVHDPVFGPAWEVPYDDFEVMWSAADHMYCVLAPRDGTRPFVATTSAYPPRTSDQRAAEHYLYGYSLAATGKATEADERYRAGLSVEGLSPGYRFLFLQERGFLAYRQERWEQAVSLLRQAAEQIPQAPGPWFRMAQICRDTGAAGGKSAADEFQKTAEELAGDEAGMEVGLRAFPDNLLSPAPLIDIIPGPPPG